MSAIPEVRADQGAPLELGDLVAELCRRLGADPACTAEIRIEPVWLRIRTYDLNDQGRKYVIGAPGPLRPDSGEEPPPRYRELAETVTCWAISTAAPADDEDDDS